MKDIQTKLNMRGRWERVPRDKDGDPAFSDLKHLQKVFSDEEITILTNKALYFMNYQREFHDRRRGELKQYREAKAKSEARLRSRGIQPEETK